MIDNAKTLTYDHIATGEHSRFTFGDISVLSQNLAIKYGSLMKDANPPVWVDGTAICFDTERIINVRYSEAEAESQ